MLRKKALSLFSAAALLALMVGCAAPPEKKPEAPVRPAVMVGLDASRFPDFIDDMDLDGLVHCLEKSLVYLRRVSTGRMFSFAEDRYDAPHMIRSLSTFKRFIETRPTKKEIARFIAANYRVYRSVGNKEDGKVLFTGYYEPVLRGGSVKKGNYRYPVYGMPDDLQVVDLG